MGKPPKPESLVRGRPPPVVRSVAERGKPPALLVPPRVISDRRVLAVVGQGGGDRQGGSAAMLARAQSENEFRPLTALERRPSRNARMPPADALARPAVDRRRPELDRPRPREPRARRGRGRGRHARCDGANRGLWQRLRRVVLVRRNLVGVKRDRLGPREVVGGSSMGGGGARGRESAISLGRAAPRDLGRDDRDGRLGRGGRCGGEASGRGVGRAVAAVRTGCEGERVRDSQRMGARRRKES